MKKKILLLTLTTLFMSACGSLRANCKLEGQTCDTLFGKNTLEQDERISDLEKSVASLQQDLQTVKLQSNNLSVNYDMLESELTNNYTLLYQLQNTVSSNYTYVQQMNATLNNSINNLQIQLNNQNNLINGQQTQINNILSQLATLNGYNNITGFFNPCGDKSGKIDEVFIQLSSGEMLASFSDNGSALTTRFALLSPGSFETTDGTSCYFNVVADPQPGKPNKVKITNEHY